MSTPPSATPTASSRSGWGCLFALLLLPFVIVAGLVIGTLLNHRGDSTGEASSTLDHGTLDGAAWRVDAVRDVDGQTCAFLYQDGEQLAGSCDVNPEDATFGDQTVVFGKAPAGAASVQVELTNGTVVAIDTVTADGIDGRYFVQVVPGDVDVEAFAP